MIMGIAASFLLRPHKMKHPGCGRQAVADD